MINIKKNTHYGSVHLKVLGRNELPDMDYKSDTVWKDSVREASKILGLPEENIFLVRQTHSTEGYEAPFETSEGFPEGDWIFTRKEKTAVLIRTADCMPVFFYSRTKPLVGIIHAGWKGTAAGIVPKVLDFLGEHLSSADFFLGPCIRRDRYEVQTDVSSLFENYPEAVSVKDAKIQLGLEYVLKKQLEGRQFEDSKICTFDDPDYFSHRGKDSGRNWNIIYSEFY
ncbi:MAG TPA: polyphenol oxidase family protein [Leptospiraceae bacterium]|mgnify:CR=1 FL=1|nr:polyphenol oxidase family protein [Leptospiraceae bacterium]HNH09657.1 polyphenol oxidase family protein [Leptospiraceae bacterium]HNI26645.1 polyphenol oxidase family protein [Leptospiraceae bacterium]HNI95897.1 polyphenol oxidase family protein [Leptospiraceae bacterium]HNO25991.1 polyphenol oxidase family protein [Leptospiraceae bacterium]